MNILINLIALLWIGRIAINICSFTYLWWIKEYRFDRMKIHLGTKQGKRLYFSSLRKPPMLPKALVLVFLSVATSVCIFYTLPYSILVKLFILDILSFPITALFVAFLKIPTFIYHAHVIGRAVKLLRAHKPMTVIGVTGSYGKTSVKEYTATLLSVEHKVLKTEGSKNSPIAIAELLLKCLRPDHVAFVVEMGAYKLGEIRQMSLMTRPEIGIVVAINEQHQDLFGSIQTTMKAKYELIGNLIGRRIGIFNADDERVMQMSMWAARDGVTVVTFGRKSGSDFHIGESESSLSGTQFELTHKKERVIVKTKILGAHQSLNITAAIAAAVMAGMPLKKAAAAADHLEPVAKVLQPVQGVNGSLFINDTFNNNPDAAAAAIEFLRTTPGKSILVFQPMIELGTYAEPSHERIGKMAGKHIDEIILTNGNYLEAFTRGVGSAKTVHVFSTTEAADFIRSHVGNNDWVLFKGKESERILTQLL